MKTGINYRIINHLVHKRAFQCSLHQVCVRWKRNVVMSTSPATNCRRVLAVAWAYWDHQHFAPCTLDSSTPTRLLHVCTRTVTFHIWTTWVFSYHKHHKAEQDFCEITKNSNTIAALFWLATGLSYNFTCRFSFHILHYVINILASTHSLLWT